MFTFNPEVTEILRKAGWFPTRSVPVSQWLRPLVDVGYYPFPAATKILENLGGLEITPPLNDSNCFFPGKITFDPVFAASSEFDRVEKWQKDYGLALFPLGEYDPLYILLCAEDGSIFGARERRVYFLGKTIESALELRILARDKPVLLAKHT